ncbi:MAG: hypothetical protein KDC98_16730, partial [Planctomycetes bacterium]|nr:hypothetical protein [Planctomycetota bacterium]
LRMNIDFEGGLPNPASPGGSPAGILIDRPQYGSTILAAWLQYGIPAYPMPVYFNPLIPGVELWVDTTSVYTTSLAPVFSPGFDQSIRYSLVFPPGNNIYIVQAVCMLANLTFAGSPGMVVNY